MNNKSILYKKKKLITKKIKVFSVVATSLMLIAAVLTVLSLNFGLPYYVLKIIVPIITTCSLGNIMIVIKNIIDKEICANEISALLNKNNRDKNDNVINNDKVKSISKEKSKNENLNKVVESKTNQSINYVDFDEIINKYYGNDKRK